MDTVSWTMRRERPLSTHERLMLQARYARMGRGRFELYLTAGGPVVAAGRHEASDVETVFADVGHAAEGLGVDVVVGDPARWPQSAVRADELVTLPDAACAQVLMAVDRGEDWAERALRRFGPEDIVECWLAHYRMLHGSGAAAGWRAARAVGPEAYAPRVLELWDAAEDRAERASIRTLLQHFVHVPMVEDRLARDYLFSLRAGDRYLAEVLAPGSDRVAAVYAQVILRRAQKGRGLARYAVRHLAQRGDGERLLGAVLASDRFLPRDKIAVLQAHPHRAWWAAILPVLARDHGVFAPTDAEGLAACMVHPEPAVRELARQAASLEGAALPLPRGTWEDHLAGWGIAEASLDELLQDGIDAGMALIEAHGDWLHGLSTLRAPVEPVPRRSRPDLAVTVLQEWTDELVRIRVAPAPARSRPRLEVTLRDDEGCILDLFELGPVRFDGTVAVFEAWRVGKRAVAVAAQARLKRSSG